MATWVYRQIETARNLEIAPREDAEMLTFTVEEIRDVLFVTRSWRPASVRNLAYHETFAVGARGGIRTLTSAFI